MVNVKINGLNLRYTMGTLMAIASVNEEGDTLTPLTGLKDSDHGAYILYGALASFNEKHNLPTEYTLQDCKLMVKDFTGRQYIALISKYNKLVTVDENEEVASINDESDGEEVDKKK